MAQSLPIWPVSPRLRDFEPFQAIFAPFQPRLLQMAPKSRNRGLTGPVSPSLRDFEAVASNLCPISTKIA